VLAQTLAVALIVSACALYAAWRLMPAAARRAFAAAALRLPLPARITAPLQRAAQGASGCHCDGCGNAAPPPAGAVQPVKFHRRTLR